MTLRHLPTGPRAAHATAAGPEGPDGGARTDGRYGTGISASWVLNVCVWNPS